MEFGYYPTPPPLAAAVKAIWFARVTRRHLERLFQDEVGLRLKQVARITRIQSVLAVLRARPSDSGAEIAARFGYSDQAHLIHECRALTGRTPARLTSTERSLAALMRKGPPARP